jgi:hypothetical protein
MYGFPEPFGVSVCCGGCVVVVIRCGGCVVVVVCCGLTLHFPFAVVVGRVDVVVLTRHFLALVEVFALHLPYAALLTNVGVDGLSNSGAGERLCTSIDNARTAIANLGIIWSLFSLVAQRHNLHQSDWPPQKYVDENRF